MNAAGAACRHCTLPLPEGRGPFCCTGCAFVHGLLARPEEGGTASSVLLGRLAVSAVLAMGVMVASVTLYGVDAAVDDEAGRAVQGVFRMGALLLSLPVLLLLGVPLADSVLRERRFLGADALVLLGVGAAFLASTWAVVTDSGRVWFDTATGVLVLVTLGRWLDVRARERAAVHLGSLARAARRSAWRSVGDGELEVDPSELRPGDEIRVRVGEALPVDGEVLAGRAFVDRSALTGESVPRAVGPGDEVLAGTLALDGGLTVRVVRGVGTRLVDEIERHLREASRRRAHWVRLADRVSGAFLPVVLVVAVGAGVWHTLHTGPEAGGLAALAVVLIACPCALGLATPLTFWVALGEAWRRGALVRGADVLERLAGVRRMAFDKTGTLTTGELDLEHVEVLAESPLDAASALALAAGLERHVRHPIGAALEAEARARGLAPEVTVEDVRSLPGRGLRGSWGGRALFLGRPTDDAGSDGRTVAELSVDGRPAVRFRLSSRTRSSARATLARLRELGLETFVLSGDDAGAAEALARELGVAAHGELLPLDKVARLEADARGVTAFVGDGVNDAPALGAAGVGIAMGSAAAVSLESAAVSLLHDRLEVLPELVELSRRAVRVARVNLLWAFGYNAVGVVLAARGELSPLFAASAMVVSSAFVVAHSLRLARDPRRSASAPGSVADRPMRLEPAIGD